MNNEICATVNGVRKAGYIMLQGISCLGLDYQSETNSFGFRFSNTENFKQIKRNYHGERIEKFADLNTRRNDGYFHTKYKCVPVFSKWCAGFLMLCGVPIHHVDEHNHKDTLVYYFEPSERMATALRYYEKTVHYLKAKEDSRNAANFWLDYLHRKAV